MTTPTASAAQPPASPWPKRPPSHLELPCEDGQPVRNTQEPPQSALLTDSLGPVLRQRHPADDYYIGQDVGIYWWNTEPPLRGVKSPDWYYVPGVPHLLNGQMRRSYVLWNEPVPPLIVLEYATGGTAEEHDRTPWEGKFWVYEQVIRPGYYGIFDIDQGRLEVYALVSRHYELMPANERGHYPIAELGVELGLWRGVFQGYEAPWLRWWTLQGELLLTGEERAERLAARLRAAGINPDQP